MISNFNLNNYLTSPYVTPKVGRMALLCLNVFFITLIIASFSGESVS